MAVEHSLHVRRVRSRQGITQFVWTKHLTQTPRVIGLYLMTLSEDFSDLNSYISQCHITHITLMFPFIATILEATPS